MNWKGALAVAVWLGFFGSVWMVRVNVPEYTPAGQLVVSTLSVEFDPL